MSGAPAPGAPAGAWPSAWPAEDGGPRRLQAPHGVPGLGLGPDERLVATSRPALASTMVVTRGPDEVYLLGHTGGDDAVSWVERIDPVSLEVIDRSPDLAGGPPWPGGLAAHADGSLHVVFGRHAHRLGPDTSLLASTELPRDRPYNSFVTLADGHLVTKDFGGVLPASATPRPGHPDCELVVLDPESLRVVARATVPEPSVARLSATDDTVYVVGADSLLRARWDGRSLTVDEAFRARYRTEPGQGHGWDAVLTEDAAWFLDDGEGTQAYAGSLRGLGVATEPLSLVGVSLADGTVTKRTVCGRPGGIVANPPALDPVRRIAVAYDTGNGAVAAFDLDAAADEPPRWTAELDHGGHPIVFPDSGEVVLGDHRPDAGGEHAVVLDIATGAERGRVATGSPVQSVLFGAAGPARDLYLCTFTTVTRVTVAPA